ncbi:glycoside hydrolase family 10 protein [Ilyonectria sp. MPI-CAGE-AT-0026]|nr:glycoside hydrolase family 10 protein [Ilyonectria sp. MPI-CAGE-AT-0026]
MKAALVLLLTPLAAALPAAFIQLDSELAVRRENVTERMATLDERQASVSIDQLFKNKGKVYIGSATDRGLLQTGKNAAILQANFGQVTPENSMKWDALQPSQGQFNWDNADYLVNWAQQNGKSIRGHTLVWHSQLPQWVKNINNADTLRQVIRTHVKAAVGRYSGKIRAWDVVNEIFNEDGTLRSSVFSNLLGEEFVSIAFKAAREADPYARLYINDYNLDKAGSSKVNLMRYYVDKWISQGVPIDGIGTQTHISGGGGSSIQGALEQLATAPVTEIAITELDIAQAPVDDYVAAVRGCWNVAKCWGITVWGISDKDSWRTGANPLLFDSNYNAKAAYWGIVDLLD